MSIKKEYQKLLIDIIQKHIPNSKIYLFGSQATQTSTESSDIYIALDAERPISLNIIMTILAEIDETIIPLKVDVVDLAGVNESFKKSIFQEGILWKN